MGLSTAERNKRKRERKKREREEQRQSKDLHSLSKEESIDVEIQYVPEPLQLPVAGLGDFEEVRLLQERSAALITDDELQFEEKINLTSGQEEYDDDDDEDGSMKVSVSKRKLRDILRPSVAELKQRVKRPDLVEAHDVTAADPEFLICLKAVPGTVPVPRHWGRKRKYLQGKVSTVRDSTT